MCVAALRHCSLYLQQIYKYKPYFLIYIGLITTNLFTYKTLFSQYVKVLRKVICGNPQLLCYLLVPTQGKLTRQYSLVVVKGDFMKPFIHPFIQDDSESTSGLDM